MSSQASAGAASGSGLRRPVAWIRDLPIWTKLGLIMIVPTLATIGVGTAGLFDQVGRATDAERARSLTVLSGDAGALVHGLQAERKLTVRILSEGDASVMGEQLRTGQGEVNEAYARYRQSRAAVVDLPASLNDVLGRIDTEMNELADVRAAVAQGVQLSRTATELAYTGVIEDLLALRESAAPLAGDLSLTNGMRASASIALANEFMAQEQATILKAMAAGILSNDLRRDYLSSLTGQDLALGTFRSVAAADQLSAFEQLFRDPMQVSVVRAEARVEAVDVGGNPASGISAADWDSAMTGRATALYELEQRFNSDAEQSAIEVGAAVQRRVLIQTGGLLATLLLGILFAWMVARSMARSLRDLRQGALAVAQYGLPQAVARLRDPALSNHQSPQAVALQIAEPLPVLSRDEFGQVTEAFNAVHLEAVRTAAEQAALRASVATMFVNLARRSQILVDRIIGHLDRLERGEQDPDRLAELFQLDHLATRMRRNDENLLVLAGADSTRIQREPAALTDVLRAAQSEVEHYTRIEFTAIDSDIEIAAHAVNDLVHLVAELFDNATAFSAPDTIVRVEAHRIGDRAVLQITDRGIGMSADLYADLNDRLATPPMVDVAVSRMMGLVVVSRLANRHGVKVELRPSPDRGTVADVVLPSGVLVPRALSGRSHAPDGFPAARPNPMTPVASAPAVAGPRSPFGPPLALEGPSVGRTPGSAPAGLPVPATSMVPPPVALPPAPVAPPPMPVVPPPPRMEAPTFAPGADTYDGLGAALTATAPPGGGRALPAWADLAGASDASGRAASDPAAGLPQRRPGPESAPGPVARPPAEARWGAPPPTPGQSGPAYPPPPPPPAWPPAPGLPRDVSARLDLAADSAPSRGGRSSFGGDDDMTQELPIFRELESRWFSDAPGTVGAGGAPGADHASDGVSWRSSADDGWQAAQAAERPQDGGTTDMGLPRRVPMAQLVPGGGHTVSAPVEGRTPDAVRGVLSAFTGGVQRGRSGYGRDQPTGGRERES